MEVVGYICIVVLIIFGVFLILNEVNVERLVCDFVILILYMVGLNEFLCFGEKNVFFVCNYKSFKDIYILMIIIWIFMYYIWIYIYIVFDEFYIDYVVC